MSVLQISVTATPFLPSLASMVWCVGTVIAAVAVHKRLCAI